MVKEKLNFQRANNPNWHKILEDVVRPFFFFFTKMTLCLVTENKIQPCKCAQRKPHSAAGRVAQIIYIAPDNLVWPTNEK